jgi:hypothetical protein
MSKETIVAKALKCIDEVYPSENTLNDSYFPTETFIDEMVRWVIDAVPAHTLGEGAKLRYTNCTVDEHGVGTITLANTPIDGRIVYFHVSDWKRPVLGTITDTHALYAQQKNKVLRGNPSRPIVALTKGETKIEFYSTTLVDNQVDWQDEIEVKYLPYSIDLIPPRLEDIAAWKLAEIVLMSMSDAQSASICTAKVNEHLEILAL